MLRGRLMEWNAAKHKGRRRESNAIRVLLTYKLPAECWHSVAHIGHAVQRISVNASINHANFVTDTPQEPVVFFGPRPGVNKGFEKWSFKSIGPIHFHLSNVFIWVTGLLTRHCHLKAHLFKMALTNSPTCERCVEKDESATHILCDCEAKLI
jgi:hypothetical protein